MGVSEAVCCAAVEDGDVQSVGVGGGEDLGVGNCWGTGCSEGRCWLGGDDLSEIGGEVRATGLDDGGHVGDRGGT